MSTTNRTRSRRPFSSISHKRPPVSITASSAARTRAAGRNLARLLRPGDIVLLCGPVGSGKTTFAQGVAAGLGIRAHLRSSSFMLVNEYAARGVRVYHMDLYRMEGVPLEDCGLDEYLTAGGICIVEWADHIRRVPARAFWRVAIRPRDENTREITITHHENSCD